MMKDAYAAAGVDIEAANEAVARYRRLLSRRADPRVLEGIGAFGGCFQFEGFKHPVLVASTDGVGTKVLVAAALGRYDTIGRDLVNHCINDILCAGAQPLFFLDYFAVSKLNVEMSSAVVSGIAAACAEFELALLGGETAEMPGFYADGAFDVVVAMYVMTVVPNPERVMQELVRVCAPGCEVMVVNHFSQDYGAGGWA